ncbi:hypothetical protein KKA53_03910 [Candidatus Dependentiae bacterium]|nr:hypothetical protein [Candidatus Dependentiae bacterium]
MMNLEENKKTSGGEQLRLVECLSHLPHKILQNHDLHGLPQLILHELGHHYCFGLTRAVYLIDNPDFDHLVGAAGFCHKECQLHNHDLWSAPNNFAKDMKLATFHNEMRRLVLPSFKRKDIDLHNASEVKSLGSSLGLENPDSVAWDMKHGNHGILLFESSMDFSSWKRELLKNAVALLSL